MLITPLPQASPQHSRKQRNQAITRLTQSLSEQAAPQSVIRRVFRDGPPPIDARNLAASPPTSTISKFKPGQQKNLRQAPTREPQSNPARRGDSRDARSNSRLGPTTRQPRTRSDNVGSPAMRRDAGSREPREPKESRSRRALQPESGRSEGNPRNAKAMLQEQKDRVDMLMGVSKEAPLPTEYQPPAEISQDSLAGYGPALSLGERGMSELIGDRVRGVLVKLERRRDRQMRLARKRAARDLLDPTGNGEPKVGVVHSTQEGQRDGKEEGEGNGDVSTKPGEDGNKAEPATNATDEDNGDLLTTDQRNELVERLLGGSYDIGSWEEGGVVGELRRATGRNGSYLPADGEKLLEKVRELLPVQGAGRKATRV